jgi:hypothetical protein
LKTKSNYFFFIEDKTGVKLKDLQSSTKYEVQLEANKKRRHQITNGILFFCYLCTKKT